MTVTINKKYTDIVKSIEPTRAMVDAGEEWMESSSGSAEDIYRCMEEARIKEILDNPDIISVDVEQPDGESFTVILSDNCKHSGVIFKNSNTHCPLVEIHRENLKDLSNVLYRIAKQYDRELGELT